VDCAARRLSPRLDDVLCFQYTQKSLGNDETSSHQPYQVLGGRMQSDSGQWVGGPPPLKTKSGVGVIVGRFQTPYLSEGHSRLLQTAHESSDSVLIFVGVNPTNGSRRDPLDFLTRERMLRDYLPSATILPLPDRETDKDWVTDLHSCIRQCVPHGGVTLYHGRDSFLATYRRVCGHGGGFPTVFVDEVNGVSGTMLRKEAAGTVLSSSDFRAGAIYAATHRYPVSYQAVDALALNTRGELLLVRKRGARAWRLPGGFVDPIDASLEEAVIREVQEETGLICRDLYYDQSVGVNDWRFLDQENKILSAVFVAQVDDSPPTPGDSEIAEAAFFDIKEGALALEHIAAEHRGIVQTLSYSPRWNTVGTKETQ
jgi:bifunctional NMN adenylyltransferase/nudix hydrolase